MTTNNNKYILNNEIVWIKQLLFTHVTFLSSSQVAVVFNIPSLHASINLPNRCFSYEQILTTKYSSVLHVLSH